MTRRQKLIADAAAILFEKTELGEGYGVEFAQDFLARELGINHISSDDLGAAGVRSIMCGQTEDGDSWDSTDLAPRQTLTAHQTVRLRRIAAELRLPARPAAPPEVLAFESDFAIEMGASVARSLRIAELAVGVMRPADRLTRVNKLIDQIDAALGVRIKPAHLVAAFEDADGAFDPHPLSGFYAATFSPSAHDVVRIKREITKMNASSSYDGTNLREVAS